LQDTFLDHLRQNKVPLTVVLVNGVKLHGRLVEFDSVSLLLQRGPDAQLLHKHAISTITPLTVSLGAAGQKAEVAAHRPLVQIRPRRPYRPQS
jgi:host factor-I protein